MRPPENGTGGPPDFPNGSDPTPRHGSPAPALRIFTPEEDGPADLEEPPQGWLETMGTFAAAMSAECRLKIMGTLGALRSGERVAVKDMVRKLGYSQPNLSKHLASLVADGYLVLERDGRESRYAVTPKFHEHAGLFGNAMKRIVDRAATEEA